MPRRLVGRETPLPVAALNELVGGWMSPPYRGAAGDPTICPIKTWDQENSSLF